MSTLLNLQSLEVLKLKLAVKKVNISLGHASRRGGESVAKMAQISLFGEPLVGVSEQVARLDFDKGFAKHRAAYVEGLGFCVAIPNEATDKTTTVTMPLPMKKVEDFVTPIEKFPTSIMNKGTKNMYPDFELIKHDDKGNVIAKAVEENGNWSLAKYNMPVYKQRVNQYGESISILTSRNEKRVGVLKDNIGTYLENTNKFTFCALFSIAIVPGFAVSASGTKIQGSDGLYIVRGNNEDKEFQKVTAGGSAAKFSIGSLVKLITHPSYGIASSSDLTNDGYLKQGSCKIDTKGTRINAYNSDLTINTEFSKVISDRSAFRLSAFKAKGVRAASLEDSIVEGAKETKKEITVKVLEANDIF